MLAYNLIRKTIAIAAAQRSVLPYQISFKGALQTRMNFLASLHVDTDLDQWCIRLLSAIASEEIGNRPDRVEPRVKKRRPKPYDAMTKPRSEYKKAYRRRTYIKVPVPFGSFGRAIWVVPFVVPYGSCRAIWVMSCHLGQTLFPVLGCDLHSGRNVLYMNVSANIVGRSGRTGYPNQSSQSRTLENKRFSQGLLNASRF